MRFTGALFASALNPYQILSVPRSSSAKEIKAAYLGLCKKHHPDLPTASRPASGVDFRDITAAYELLRDKGKREMYNRYGIGWGTDGGRESSSTASAMRYDPWREHRAGQSRRPHRYAHQRSNHPSSSWDFGHSDSTEFYSSNRASTSKDETIYASNGSFISLLAGLSLLLYSVQYWRLAPPLPYSNSNFMDADPKDAPIYREGGIMRGRDRHHEMASNALAQARNAAKAHGEARRDGIRRQVRASHLSAIRQANEADDEDEEGDEPSSSNLSFSDILSSSDASSSRPSSSLPQSNEDEYEDDLQTPNPHQYVRQHIPSTQRLRHTVSNAHDVVGRQQPRPSSNALPRHLLEERGKKKVANDAGAEGSNGTKAAVPIPRPEAQQEANTSAGT